MQKIKWGIISTAQIGVNKVIPGTQKSDLCDVVAISSRNQNKAEEAAKKLGIPRAYGSYEDLIADPDIDAIYNPLPNHLHVEWTIKAMHAGKHVLCEKPIGMDVADAQLLLDECKKHSDLKVMEAFMYRFHPQWVKVKELVRSGAIGEVKTVQSFFSYFNNDPNNIRNMADIGGGGLLDIGCYNISFPRFLFDSEPQRVVGLVDYDPQLKTDRIASGIMDFSGGISSTFTCSTQMMPFQRCLVVGTEGSIEIEIPVNAPPDKPTRIWLMKKSGKEEITLDITDQYTSQADAFAKAILNNTPVPTPLLDAVNNMKVIDAVFESGRTEGWVGV
ncbi:MAG: Gfo/Idh/MocA family oxidoreductase [Bacteroidetes bacterium]|nr:Gfo/Idh/MocA family oxidoreductase [Bacteroidota bacterium]MDA1120804.1 Gfo/Idh/MocA family oxidoreductase [Bacteroidota bacterium]